MQLHFLLVLDAVASLHAQVEQGHAIIDHSLLDLVVKRAVRLERWHLIDLNKASLKLMVEHDIEAQYLKAKAVLNVIWLARAIQVVHVRLGQAHSLHDDLINVTLHPLHRFIPVIQLYLLQYELVRSFTTYIIRVTRRILHKIARLLVNSIIGQVHAQIVKIRRRRATILNCCETGQTVSVNIHSQRCDAIDEHVDSQIKLVAVY